MTCKKWECLSQQNAHSYNGMSDFTRFISLERSAAVVSGRPRQHGSNEYIIITSAAPVAEKPTHRNLMASTAPPASQKTN